MLQIDNCVDFFNKLIFDKLVEKQSWDGNLIIIKKVPIKCWVAGGALKSYFLGKKPTDIDIFFPNQEEFEKAKELFHGDYPIFENDNVVKYKYKDYTIDLCKKHFPTPQETIDNFDFTVTCCAVDSIQIYHHPSFFIDLAKKQLMINKITYPVSTLWRLQKYILGGFRICKQEMLKIVKSIQDYTIETTIGQNIITPEIEGSDSNLFNGID